jgi:ABC-type transporter Mla maintaining outer membrane lipid asymmetry permease subunit MlaE
MQRILEKIWNRLFEPIVGIIGGTYTASEVTHAHFSFFSNVFNLENISYLIIGTIGAFLFGVAAYLARKMCDYLFQTKKQGK